MGELFDLEFGDEIVGVVFLLDEYLCYDGEVRRATRGAGWW